MNTRNSKPKFELELDDIVDEESHERYIPSPADPVPQPRTTPPPIGYQPSHLSSRSFPSEPDLRTRPTRRPIPPNTRLATLLGPSELRALPLDAKACYVLGLIDDGSTTKQDLIDGSALPQEETEGILDDLVQLGAVGPF